MQSRKDHVAKIKAIKGGYWLGASGEVATSVFWEQKSHQDGIEWWYIDHAPGNTKGNKDAKNLWMGQLVRDCSGENKEALWRQPDGSLKPNKDEDLNETMLYNKAKAMGLPNGSISTLPLVEGICLWFDGHYGELICENGIWYGKESRSGDIGVIQYEIGKRPNTSHQWTNWFYNPFVDYSEGEDMIIKSRIPTVEVYDLQTSYKDLGYDLGAWKNMYDPSILDGRDGKYGDGMIAITTDFQGKHGLTENIGNVDFLTYGKIALALIDKKNAEKQSLSNEIAVLSESVRTKTATISALSLENTGLKSTNTTLVQEKANLANEIQAKNSAIANLENKVGAFENENGMLEKDNAELVEKIDSDKFKIDTIDERIRIHKEEVDNLKEQIAKLEISR